MTRDAFDFTAFLDSLGPDGLGDLSHTGPALPAPDGGPAPLVPVIPTTGRQQNVYRERCVKCGGSGKFRSYTGRIVGLCLKCNGTGELTFKTSAEQRERNRANAGNARRREAEVVTATAAVWKEENAAEWAWIEDAARRDFGFAVAMAEALHKYGSLTDGQMTTVKRLTQQSAERKRQWESEKAIRDASAAAIDIARIEEAFETAMGNGIKRPKLRLDTFKFAPAPAHGRNAGAVYVTEGDSYLGKVQGGRFSRSRECSADQETRILAAASDPAAAAIAYGKRYGSCSVCGRELSNHASIEAGIGPICAQKYGF